MKILFVTPYLASAYGGTSKVVMALASSLGKLGLTVDIVTTNADDGGTLALSTHQWLMDDYYRIQYFPCWHRSDLILSPTLGHWLMRHIQGYDLVHTHTLFAPLISFTHSLCRFHKVPYIMTPHGMLEPWALAYKAWKKRFYYSHFEKPALEGASRIHVLSNAEIEQVTKLGYSKTVLIPNGVNFQEFASLPDAALFHERFPELRTKKLILFLGRIDPKKGLDLLAPAFARVHQAFPDTHLVIAGPDSIHFTPTAQSYFADANCLDAVTFVGMMSGSLKYAALAAAELYVSSSYSEGFSMSVLEGMAAGLPCIITENCNFPEAKVANAAYVVKTNAQAIGDALLACLQSPEAAQQTGKRAQQFIFQNYTWEQSAKKLLKVYDVTLKRYSSLVRSLDSVKFFS